MSTDSHKRFLEKAALREAQKAMDRSGRNAFKKEDFGSLWIQTVEPWKRIFLALFGVLFCGAGFYMLKEDVAWLAVVFFATGAFCVFASILGKKKTVVAALDGIDLFTLLEALF